MVQKSINMRAIPFILHLFDQLKCLQSNQDGFLTNLKFNLQNKINLIRINMRSNNRAKFPSNQYKNWGQLLKIQDEYSKQQDLKKKRQQKIYQQLYKKQLQSVIKQQKSRDLDDIQQDKRLNQFSISRDNTIIQKQLEERRKWQDLRQKFSHDNLYSSLDRKRNQKQQNQCEKKKFNDRFKKLSTEISQEKQYQQRSHSLKQHELALAYDQQLEQERMKKYLNRQQDIKIQSLAKRIQDQKERERQSVLNKIRFGYAQDDRVFSISREAQQNRIKQRNSFIQSVASSQRQIKNSLPEQLQTLEKSRLLKQISTFNREQFQNKIFRKKISFVEENLSQHQKLQHLNKILQEEKMQKQMQKQRQKKQLQSELQRQIRQFEQNKINSTFMNPQEFKINSSLYKSIQKPVHMSFLPGVAYDKQVQKQQKLIQKFLMGGNRQSARIDSKYRNLI